MLYEVIINSESGSGVFRDPQNQTRLAEIFRDRGHDLTLDVVEPANLDSMLQKGARSSADILIIGGGDGTITAAAKLLKGTDKVLGVLPLGTFNLEARHLRIPLDPFAAAEELLDSDTTEIDLLAVNDECCMCATVIGFYPALAKSRESFHGRSWWWKTIRLFHEIATVATRAPALNLEIVSEGESIIRKTRLAAFSPGSYVESMGIIPDRQELSSGKLSGYVSEHLTRYDMLKAAWGYLTGNLLETDRMTRVESEEIVISVGRRSSIPAMIDGEILRIQLPCRLKILPRALKVLRPRNPAN